MIPETAPRRFGIILPSVNTVVEDDFRRFPVGGVATHVTRIRLKAATTDAQVEALEEAPDAAGRLGDAGMDAIMLACTGASMVRGADGNGHFAESVKPHTDVPVSTVAEALICALNALGLRSVSLFTPFDEAITQMEAGFLADSGFGVSATRSLGFRNARLCAELSVDDLVAEGASLDRAGSDGVILSCANIRGFEAASVLERKIDKPVVATNQAMLWQLMRMTGLKAVVPNGGRLLSSIGD